MLPDAPFGLVGELRLRLHARVEVAGSVLGGGGGGGGGGGQGAFRLPPLHLPPLGLRVHQLIVGAVLPGNGHYNTGER